MIRALTRLSLGNSFFGTFAESVQWVSGNKETLVENLLWRFQDKQIVALNAELNQRVRTQAQDPTTGEEYIAIARPARPDLSGWTPLFPEQDPDDMRALVTEAGDFILWPVDYSVDDNLILTIEESKIVYLMPIPFGYTPLSIATEDRELTIGLSYYARNGFLVFKEPPMEIFPKRSFVVRSAWKKLNHPHDYVWGVEDI